ncbi:uncharacterized protein LOC111100515 isoform X1 [Crassostrea virginica]
MQGIRCVRGLLRKTSKLLNSKSAHFHQKALLSFCATCGDFPEVKKTGLSVETLDCLKVDFSNQDFDHLRPSQNDEFLQDVSSIKPEVILTDHIQESQFLMQTNATLRMLGYTGHLGCLQNGRGLGVFVRKDIADRLTLVPKTIFQ